MRTMQQASYLAEVLARLIAGHPAKSLNDLLPWHWVANQPVQRAA